MTESAEPMRVVVAEDQKGMRNLVRLLLDEQDDLTVVAEAGTGDEVLAVAKTAKPDALVLDLGMPGLDGELVLDQLHQEAPGVRVVVLSGQASALVAPRVLERGASAVVEKGVGAWEQKLLAALRADPSD